jgi:uncharacterized protein YbbK (DUF523 family)
MAARPKLLISACLLGRAVRYDGSAKPLHSHVIARWAKEGRLVPLCPELLAGLPTPRPAAEIAGGDGAAVLDGAATIVTGSGDDETAAYLAGAGAALDLARRHGCRLALLTDGSPSCGSSFVHDGSFTGRTEAGVGVATALLRADGVAVFSPDRIAALARLMDG